MVWRKSFLFIVILLTISSFASNNAFAEYKPLTNKELEALTASITKLLESDTNEINIQTNLSALSLNLDRTRRSLNTESQFFNFSKLKIFGRAQAFLNTAIEISTELELTLLSDHLKSLAESPINSSSLVQAILTDLNNIRRAILSAIQPGIPNLFG